MAYCGTAAAAGASAPFAWRPPQDVADRRPRHRRICSCNSALLRARGACGRRAAQGRWDGRTAAPSRRRRTAPVAKTRAWVTRCGGTPCLGEMGAASGRSHRRQGALVLARLHVKSERRAEVFASAQRARNGAGPHCRAPPGAGPRQESEKQPPTAASKQETVRGRLPQFPATHGYPASRPRHRRGPAGPCVRAARRVGRDGRAWPPGGHAGQIDGCLRPALVCDLRGRLPRGKRPSAVRRARCGPVRVGRRDQARLSQAGHAAPPRPGRGSRQGAAPRPQGGRTRPPTRPCSQFKEISEAYEVLRDEEKRRLYDRVRRGRRRRCPAPRAASPPFARPVRGRRPRGRCRRGRGHERHFCGVFRCVRGRANDDPVPCLAARPTRAPCPGPRPAVRRISQHGPAIPAREDRRHCAGPAGAAPSVAWPPPHAPPTPVARPGAPAPRCHWKSSFPASPRSLTSGKTWSAGRATGAWTAADPAPRRPPTPIRPRRRPASVQCPPRTSRRATCAVAPAFALLRTRSCDDRRPQSFPARTT